MSFSEDRIKEAWVLRQARKLRGSCSSTREYTELLTELKHRGLVPPRADRKAYIDKWRVDHHDRLKSYGTKHRARRKHIKHEKRVNLALKLASSEQLHFALDNHGAHGIMNALFDAERVLISAELEQRRKL